MKFILRKGEEKSPLKKRNDLDKPGDDLLY